MKSMPSKGEIFEHWKTWLDKNGFDWGEPTCWACRYGFNGKYDITDFYSSDETIKKHWNKSSLQRCHIIPKSLGGNNHPENLFLMCKECHDLAPNTSFKDVFMRWAEKQNYFERIMKRNKKLFEVYGIELNDENCGKMNSFILTEKFRDWFRDNSGLHWNQQGLGNKLTPSTFVGLIVKYFEEYDTPHHKR